MWREINTDDSGIGNVTTITVAIFDYNNFCFKAIVGYDIVTKSEKKEMVSLVLNDISKKRNCDSIWV